MVALLVIAVLQGVVPSPVDSVYSTTRVRQLVERASISNRRVPEGLAGYDARVESEMAFIARQPDGIEQTFTVEQAATTVHWDRSGQFEQRVVGYRSQSVGVTISAVGLFREAWVVPILYGNRMTLLFGLQDSTRRQSSGQRRRANAVIAVHPFADDRDRLYQFSGGDTVVTIKPGGREIPIVRVHVEPHGDRLTREATAFRGDIELDEQRAQIVRMRGYFVTVGPRANARSRLIASPVEAIAYMELENGEFEGHYWLPTYQRIEAQASISLLGDQRAVFRVVSRFRNMTVNPPRSVTTAMLGDSLRATKHRLTFASRDSIDRFTDWSRAIGESTANTGADDFLDVAPDSWRPTGPPIIRLRYQEATDLFHYNRIEGTYTGVAGEVKLRDASPGLVARGNVGWAWAEQTVRGRVSLERQTGSWWPYVRAGRSLDVTNDFREPFDSGSTLGALFSVDDYDYVDRRSTMIGLTRYANRRRTVRVRLEGGIGSDRYVAAQREHGPFTPGDSGFRFNRGVDNGRYSLASMKVEFHPDVNAAFVRPGIGATVQAEAATGDLAWRRAELRIIARRMLGPFIYAAQANVGVVVGDSIPPQQLFEIGENQNLPGYGYKEFAGNQAAVIRGLVMYPLPLWRAPMRLGRFVLPSVGPTLSFGGQGGWAAATNDAARSAILRLGTVSDSVLGTPGIVAGAPVSRPTDGFKSSIDFRLRFLGGALSIGAARATDHHESWRFVVGFAQLL
ncbi:MAG TPA: hypothetical protein VL308_12755 [Gemmatimonadaceae bacterium]|nr:hypothetical protein [Gemmatimonadaceae bacterium]